MVIKLLILIACAYLWECGGQTGIYKGKWHRTILIPLIFALYFATTRAWFFGLTILIFSNIIRMGYGNYEPKDLQNCWLANLTKDRQGAWIRALWAAIVSIAISYSFGIWWRYVFLNVLLSYYVSRYKVNLPWTDWLIGAGIGLIVFV